MMLSGTGGAGSTQGSRTASSARSLMGFVSSKLVSAHAGVVEQSMHGLKICFAAGDGNSGPWEKMMPVIFMQQSDSVPARFSRHSSQ